LRFSDTSSEKAGMLQSCESIVFGDNYGAITDNSDLLATFTRNINRGLDRFVSLVLQYDNRWEFDDSNYSNFPIGTRDLSSGQQDYTFNDEHLKIRAVEVKRENSDDWDILHPIDHEEIKRSSRSITDFQEDSGIPTWYDLYANSLWLYPPPSYNRTGGLKVYFQRRAEYFETTDQSKEPGINELYHEYLVYWACYQYAFPKRMEVASTLREEIVAWEERIKEDYQKRNKDWRPKITAKPNPNRTVKSTAGLRRHI